MMEPCPNHREILLLDVHGELKQEERFAWEKHLETCQGCLQERQRLIHTIQIVRDCIPSPELSADEAKSLGLSIHRQLNKRKDGGWWQMAWLGKPRRLVPAFAAISLMIMALGWFSLTELRTSPPFRSLPEYASEEQMIAKDFEVIRNLQFLEEMDALQKLIQVVDDHESI
jgi:hypothetical protein